MLSLAKIERWEVQYVYTNRQVAYLLFWGSHRHQIAQIAIRAEMAPVLELVHPCLCASRVSVDFVQCHYAKESSRRLDFCKPLPGVIQSQPSPCYTRHTELRTSSRLGLQREASRLVVAFRHWQRVKTLHWPCSTYLWQDTCRAFQAVPDVLVLP
jgi:hypothetical protein